MSMTAIRSAIATIVDAVSAAGMIYQYDRFAVPPENFPSVYQVSGEINFSLVTLVGMRRRFLTNIEEKVTYTYKVEVIRQHGDPDSSGLTFQTTLDTIAAAIGDDPTLGGAATSLEDEDDYLAMDQEPTVQQFAGGINLVHVATMRVSAYEIVSRT